MVWRKLLLAALLWTLALPLLGMVNVPFQVQTAKTPKKATGNAYDVIAAVNNLRQANGLAPYQINGALMAAAQAHSEYQAASGAASHTGRGGSDPKSRAIAAGYGGGAGVSVVENIYSGMNASPQQAVQWWQGDGLHLNTLLSTRHQEVGAGVASSGSAVYYTLDVGSVSGSSSGSSGSGNTAVPAAPNAPAPATALAFYPIVLATTNPDGSIVHVVQPGQALWNIAASYQIALPDLLKLNGFTENSYIFPGDKILIQPANPGASPAALVVTGSPGAPGETLTPTLGAQAETPGPRLPSRTPPNTATQLSSTASPSLSAHAESPSAKSARQTQTATGVVDPLIWFIAGLVSIGTALLILGNVLKRGA